MRDPQRIDDILKLVAYYWKKYPDLRLGQFFENIANGAELYYMEDDSLVYKIIGAYERGDTDGDRETLRKLVKDCTGNSLVFADEVDTIENGKIITKD